MSSEAASSSGSVGEEAKVCAPIEREPGIHHPILMRKEDVEACKGSIALFYMWMAWTAGVADPLSECGQAQMQRLFSNFFKEIAVFTPTEWGLSVGGSTPFGFARQEKGLEPDVNITENYVYKLKLSETSQCYKPFTQEQYESAQKEFGNSKSTPNENGFSFVKDAEEDVGEFGYDNFVKISTEQLYTMAIMQHTINLSTNLTRNPAANSGKIVHWQSTAPYFNFEKAIRKIRAAGDLVRYENENQVLCAYSASGNVLSQGPASELEVSDIWGLVTGSSFLSCKPMDSPVLIDRFWGETGELLCLCHDNLRNEGFDYKTKTPGPGLDENPLRVAMRVNIGAGTAGGDDRVRDFFWCPSDKVLLTDILLTLCNSIFALFSCPLTGRCV